LYQTFHRPIPLTEYVVIGRDVVDCNEMLVRQLPTQSDGRQALDVIGTLVSEALHKGQQVLVFCPSRNMCSIECRKLTSQANLMYIVHLSATNSTPLTHNGNMIPAQLLRDGRKTLINTLMKAGVDGRPQSSTGNDALKILCEGIYHGFAFHHAGLSEQDRELIEDGYKQGLISVLMCTSTLAAGVNLPAGRVIINSTKIGFNSTIDVVQYKQMSGRAGRAGLVSGNAESFLVIKQAERNHAFHLLTAPFPPVCSQMSATGDEGNRSLLRAILELCSLGLCISVENFKLYLCQTLIFKECDRVDSKLETLLRFGISALRFLLDASVLERFEYKFDTSTGSENSYSGLGPAEGTFPFVSDLALFLSENTTFRLSRFGAATVSSNMNPDEAIFYYSDLLRSADNMNLETDLHVAYLCVPLSNMLTPNFEKLFAAVSKGGENSFKRVISAVNITESMLFRWSRSPPSPQLINSCGDTLRRLRISSVKISKPDDSIPILSTSSKIVDKTGKISADEEELSMLCRCKRLWAAQVLVDILNSQDPGAVADAYGISLGDLQQLQQNTLLLSARIFDFASQLGWPSIPALIGYFHSKLSAAEEKLSGDAVALLKITGMNIKTAKVLAGSRMFNTVKSIALASAPDVAQCLRLSFAFSVSFRVPIINLL
jgi:hypothetical protein